MKHKMINRMFFGPVIYSSMNTSKMNQARGTKMRIPTPAAATSRMTPVGSTWKKEIKKLKGSDKENSLTLRFSPGVKATKKATCARRTPATNRCSTSDMAASTGIFDLGLANTREPPLSSSCDANLASLAHWFG